MRAAGRANGAEVVIIGAGVNGLSTACHLARSGISVQVLERRHIAAGATGQSGAIVRTHYGNLPETQLAQISMGYFHNWADTVGGSCGWQQTGAAPGGPGSEQGRAGRQHPASALGRGGCLGYQP